MEIRKTIFIISIGIFICVALFSLCLICYLKGFADGLFASIEIEMEKKGPTIPNGTFRFGSDAEDA